MKRAPKTVKTKTKMLQAAHPVYVSLVSRGANFIPWLEVRESEDAEMKTIDVAQMRFSKSNFSDLLKVNSYLSDKGFSDYVIQEQVDYFFVDCRPLSDFSQTYDIDGGDKEKGMSFTVGKLNQPEESKESRGNVIEFTKVDTPVPVDTEESLNETKELNEEVSENGFDSDEELDNASDALFADIDLTPTSGMVTAANRALAWKKDGRKGGTRVGLARANQISNKENLSPRTVKRMFSFFSRHEVDKQAEGFSEGEEGYPSPGRVAWDLWGGDAGFSWSRKKVKELNKVEMRSYFDWSDAYDEMQDTDYDFRSAVMAGLDGAPLSVYDILYIYQECAYYHLRKMNYNTVKQQSVDLGNAIVALSEATSLLDFSERKKFVSEAVTQENKEDISETQVSVTQAVELSEETKLQDGLSEQKVSDMIKDAVDRAIASFSAFMNKAENEAVVITAQESKAIAIDEPVKKEDTKTNTKQFKDMVGI